MELTKLFKDLDIGDVFRFRFGDKSTFPATVYGKDEYVKINPWRIRRFGGNEETVMTRKLAGVPVKKTGRVG